MPTGFAWGSALDLLGALDDAAEQSAPSGPAGRGAVELLDAIVGPVGSPADEDDEKEGGGPFGAETGPAYLPVPEPSRVVVPDEVIDGPGRHASRRTPEADDGQSPPSGPPAPPGEGPPGAPGGSGPSDGKSPRHARRASIATGLGACLLVGGCLVAGGVIPAHSEPLPSSPQSSGLHRFASPVVPRLLGASSGLLNLPPATTTPTPAPPVVAGSATASHEVFGYAPVLVARAGSRSSRSATSPPSPTSAST